MHKSAMFIDQTYLLIVLLLYVTTEHLHGIARRAVVRYYFIDWPHSLDHGTMQTSKIQIY
ncbi:MAG TPA: hypothetical protein DDW43_05610 [Nitrosomonas sp.]|nr:hypothetical protein [Nitrosomonas sp.]